MGYPKWLPTLKRHYICDFSIILVLYEFLELILHYLGGRIVVWLYDSLPYCWLGYYFFMLMYQHLQGFYWTLPSPALSGLFFWLELTFTSSSYAGKYFEILERVRCLFKKIPLCYGYSKKYVDHDALSKRLWRCTNMQFREWFILWTYGCTIAYLL